MYYTHIWPTCSAPSIMIRKCIKIKVCLNCRNNLVFRDAINVWHVCIYTSHVRFFFDTNRCSRYTINTPIQCRRRVFLHGWTCQLNPIDIKCEMSFDLQALLLAPYLRVNAIHKNAFFLESNFDWGIGIRFSKDPGHNFFSQLLDLLHPIILNLTYCICRARVSNVKTLIFEPWLCFW